MKTTTKQTKSGKTIEMIADTGLNYTAVLNPKHKAEIMAKYSWKVGKR